MKQVHFVRQIDSAKESWHRYVSLEVHQIDRFLFSRRVAYARNALLCGDPKLKLQFRCPESLERGNPSDCER